MRFEWDEDAVHDLADLVVYQTVFTPSVESSLVLAGADHILIDPRYAGIDGRHDGHIVVSLGGSDIGDLTARIVQALAHVERPIVVINGPAMHGFEALAAVTVINSPDSLLEYLDGAGLMIGAMGMTAYEAAAAGVPALLYSWTDDHERTALALDELGAAVSLGQPHDFDGERLRMALAFNLDTVEAWRAMHDAGKALVDGKGAARVADAIDELIDDQKRQAMYEATRNDNA